MNKLLTVFEGIIDDAAEEYRCENLASADSVDDYAINALGINLTSEESQLIYELAIDYVTRESAGEIIGSDDYYHDFQEKLV
jgi:hypothetical protein